MQPGKVRCLQCGWQNDAGDRICGGCGHALNQSGASFGTPPDYTPTIASSGAVPPPPLSQDTRTATWAAPAYPQQFAPGTSTVGVPSRAAPPYASATSARPHATRRGCAGRTGITLAIAALLLFVLVACGWAALLRPALHTAVDQRLRSGLTAEIDKVPAIPAGYPPITRSISDTEFNRQAGTPNNQGDLKDVRIHFLPGEVTMTYMLWGSPGKISAHVVAVNGRVFVQNTQVAGWLAQIETGDELQDTLNQSLAHLPAQDYVDSIIVGNGTLTMTLRHA